MASSDGVLLYVIVIARFEIVYVVDQGRGTQLGCAILPHHDGVCHTLHDNTQLAHHNGQAKERDCLDM